jgi:hypothetical protein
MRVRDKLPIRRSTTSKNPTGKNWSQHKPDLQEDFHHHCGYCGSYDGFRHTYFEVDHFIPKSLFEKNDNITYCQYDNLVYSCKFCNNNKLSKWPSGDETINIVDDKGFIDPCSEEYDYHLYRTEDGGILWKTALGEWLVKKAFKFDERDVSIKLLWELNQSRKVLEALVIEMKKRATDSEEYNIIKKEAEKLSLEYYMNHQELMDYYNSI